MSVRDLILNNFWYKIFSLVLATLIWVVVNTNFSTADLRSAPNPMRPDVTRDFRRPIILMTTANNRQLFKLEPTEVSVRVRGDATTLQKLVPEDIQVFVDLVNVTEAQGSFRIEVNAPREVSVQQIWPPHVQVKALPPDADTSAQPH